MYIPIPLCAVHSYMYTRPKQPTVVAAFIVLDRAAEISSSFHTQGQRVGNQSGLFGAYIDETTVSPYRYDTGFGARIINGPAQTSEGRFQTTQRITMSWIVCCYWTDGTWGYAAHGQIDLRVEYYFDTSYKRYVKSWKPTVQGTICRARLKQFDSIVPGASNCGYKFQSQSFSQTKDVDMPYIKKPIPVESLLEANSVLDSLWDKETAFRCFYRTAGLAMQSTGWGSSQSTLQPLYWPTGEIVDYSRIFNSLLYHFEFSDPQLADGAVAREAHYELRSQKNEWGKPVNRNVWIPRGGPFGTYNFEWLTQHAAMDALESIPKANDNSIQNIVALAELLVAIKNLDIEEIPDLLMKRWEDATRNADAAADAISDMWMRYRYEYSTTKMDIEEYIKYGLEKLDRYMMGYSASRTHGFAARDDYVCRCALSWSEKGLTGLNRFCHALWEQGLEPNSYVLWDFVPFSFVADWFVPIGDALQIYSDKQYLNASYYEFSDIVFSIRYRTGPIAGVEAEHYVRWVADRIPIVDESYWFDDGNSSTGLSTAFKRICDSGCLLYGIAGHR